MKNILLPTDFSENSWNAIKYAIHFFENTECHFYLLHVNRFENIAVNDSALMLDAEVIDKLYIKPSKQKLRDLLRQISKLNIEHKNHKFYTLTDFGFFIESIRKQVDEKEIDCIVMGTKGASGLEKIILGSNTADVITKVKCNMIAVPENAEFVKPKEIAFPTDFSLSHGLQVLQPISEILENFNSTLRILHIKKTKVELNNDQKASKELLEDYFNHNPYTFHFLSNKKVEDAIQCFVESRDIDMICMVAKNLNYFQQILFHSKVEEISYHTDIPVMVLHEKNKYYG
ncbi:universal stress protein [Winogradskyella litoriviva]|uniref:Universal stress protein n=1 Tax=Winogradskyella litoriviva TaxID=1220182 RepID=A0ABX2E7Z0_9FLAO|nr:universal stress protein [Winogradskyella litoriviva]NRD24628.1 universal stress protein [Winogradskyella litoriviva]